MNDKRKDRRQKTLKSGWVVFNNGHSTMDCTIRDLTEHGGRIRLVEPTSLPVKFKLVVGLKVDPHRQQIFAAQLVWQKGAEIGLSFAADLKAKPGASPLPRAVQPDTGTGPAGEPAVSPVASSGGSEKKTLRKAGSKPKWVPTAQRQKVSAKPVDPDKAKGPLFQSGQKPLPSKPKDPLFK